MRKIIDRPQILFVALAILTLIAAFINKGNILQVAMYATYVNVEVWAVGMFSFVFFLLIAVNYTSLTVIGKKAKRGLTITHVFLQLLALFPLFYFMFTSEQERTYDQVSQMNLILIFAFFLFIIATVIHLINFVMGLLSKKE